MLRLLQIENIAIIEKADIEFEAGLNVMTGETGAGKSIVIDSLGAVLGDRVSRGLVRTGAGSASVTAVFSGDLPMEWLRENGIEAEDELVITRKISADGKSLARVNGAVVSVTQLRELGSQLVDILGQNSGLHLLDERFHLNYLDGFGETEDELRAYREAYGEYRAIEKEMRDLEMDEGEKERRIDSLKYQIGELESANIRVGETEELEARRELLRNAGKLTEAVNEAYAALYGGDMTDGAVSLISQAEGALSSASRYTDTLESIGSKLSELRYMAEDAAEELRGFKDDLSFSPWELDELESRLDILKRLSRKYGPSDTDMLAYLDSCKKELEGIEYSDERLGELSVMCARKRAEAEKLAERLSRSRRDAAERLEVRIMDELSQLSMKGVKFKVGFEETELNSTGSDAVYFLMSANAGETPGRINKIASGGELARIMLAMKTVLAAKESVATMVFDEIDTGVSGIAAQRVGEKLGDLGRDKQVICVTHLPQIAVMADTHFAIEKTISGGRTFTHIDALDENGREKEIARLTGGENITITTLIAAREQLDAALCYKNKNREDRNQ
ncbi:MAG: DNA repair protein RecN [Oscillospiraceae bacterium]|nr:DNA repair protein RecN [Oscillospiraceae bacterium]